MKSNKIIAGLGVVAGLSVTLAPVATFATSMAYSEVTDTLQVTVEDALTFGLDVDGDGTYDAADGDVYGVTRTAGTDVSLSSGAEHAATGTFSKTMAVGENIDTFGTTELKVFANKAYYVLAQANKDIASNALAPNASHSSTSTGWSYKPTIEASDGMTLGAGNTANAKNAASTTQFPLASRNAASKTAGDTLTVVYGVGVANNQASGTYTGSMTYTMSATAAE